MTDGKLVRTMEGGEDSLKRQLVDLKRYRFSGYVKTLSDVEGEAAEGYIFVRDGKPEGAIHAVRVELVQGTSALRAVCEDSYAPECSIEVHAKIDVEDLLSAYPEARFSRIRPCETESVKRREDSRGIENANYLRSN